MSFFTADNVATVTGGRWMTPPAGDEPLRGVGIDTRADLDGRAWIVDPRRPVSYGGNPPSFRPELVSEVSVRERWHWMTACLVGGPAYKPVAAYGLPDLPRDFDVYFASFHEDPELTQMAVDWTAEFGLTTKVCTLAELQSMLERACARVIREKAWDSPRDR